MATKKEQREYVITELGKSYGVNKDNSKRLFRSEWKTGIIQSFDDIDDWLKKIEASMVSLDNRDYVQALTHALRVAPRLAGTDYGTSRQRDLGQLWTDTTRGFLGEIALAKFLYQKFGYSLVLDYTLGDIEDYLPSDIKGIKTPGGYSMEPLFPVSFKSTKFNGLWLDVPGAQIEHSEAFILIKIGVGRDHFVAFWKWISAIKDKLIPLAQEINVLSDEQAGDLWGNLPEFKKIPCYIAGFINRAMVNNLPQPNYEYKKRHYRSGKFKYNEMINYVGWVRNRKPISIPEELKDNPWQFLSIGSFSKAPHYVSSLGFLKYREGDWRNLLESLVGD